MNFRSFGRRIDDKVNNRWAQWRADMNVETSKYLEIYKEKLGTGNLEVAKQGEFYAQSL